MLDRADTSAADQRTATASLLQDHTPSPSTRRGAGNCCASNRTPTQRPSSRGSSSSALTVTPSLGSPSPQRRRDSLHVGRRPCPQSASACHRLADPHRAGDPGQSRLHRPRRVEARRHRTRTARRGQPRPGLLPVRSPHHPGPVGHLHPPRHEALVSEEHFIAVQEIDSPRRLGRRAQRRQPRRSAGYLDGQAPFPQRAARRTGLQSASCPCRSCGKHAGNCLYR